MGDSVNIPSLSASGFSPGAPLNIDPTSSSFATNGSSAASSFSGAASSIAAVSPLLGAVGKIMAGNMQASNERHKAAETWFGDNYKANQLDIDATYGQAKAAETDTFMRSALTATLQNITAVRASANVEGDSPTGFAIENRIENQADTARQQRVENINAQVQQDRASALLERSAGLQALAIGDENARAAKTSGWLGGFGTLLSGIAGAIPKGG
ncbi:hypothetical protein SAMN05519103_00357 [Rhizobiales bacterium GAS113]|nr:hypothetical protein SAMN05519103_00357 [Rhizobiales bacterium GAS113]